MFKSSATSYEPCKWPSTLVSLDKSDGNFKFLHHGTPWGLSTRQRIALVTFRPFMEKLFYKNALPHKCPIMFDAPLVVKLEATSIQLSLKVIIIINSNNHQPHFFIYFIIPFPHHMGLYSREDHLITKYHGLGFPYFLSSHHKSLTLYTLTSLCILSILFSLYFLGSNKENL